jgi:hypothetical protein
MQYIKLMFLQIIVVVMQGCAGECKPEPAMTLIVVKIYCSVRSLCYPRLTFVCEARTSTLKWKDEQVRFDSVLHSNIRLGLSCLL